MADDLSLEHLLKDNPAALKEMVKERERIETLIASVPILRVRLKLYDKLLASYGNGNGHLPTVNVADTECDVCGRKFKGLQGLGSHKRKAHGIEGEWTASRSQRKAKK